MEREERILRMLGWFAGVISLLTTVSIPALYFLVSYRAMDAALLTEAEINARIVSRIVNANPEMWQYETVRLETLLASRPGSGHPESRRVLDLSGHAVAESADPLNPPVMLRSAVLYEAGRPAGRIEIRASLLPLLERTLLFTLLGFLLGGSMYAVFRVVPLASLKRTLDLLSREKERYHQLFEGTTDAVFVHGIADDGLPGRFVEANDVACRRLGYTRDELLRMSPRDVDAPGSAVDLRSIGERLKKGESALFEQIHVAKDGRRIPVEIHVRSFPVEDRHVVFSVVRDITDRKRVEKERKKLESRLQHAMKMESVGRLAGGVAHDFNNLLTVIAGYCDLLLGQIGTDSSLRKDMEEIKRSADRAAALTQQLLAFSRKQIIEPKIVLLDEMVAEKQGMMKRLIGEDITLMAFPGKDPGAVRIDPGQFHQILVNLVVNARDAMPGGGEIVIGTSNVDLAEKDCDGNPDMTPGRYVMLSVRDTGTGIPEELQGKIFEPFFTTKAKGSGTGLGLATTYGAVRQAGGSIGVESQVGRGTTIRIYLPRVEAPARQNASETKPENARGGTETVLVVEDEDAVRRLCVRTLEKSGYRVLQAENGPAAIAMARNHAGRIDLLLTDVVMPGMNGGELARQMVLLQPAMRVLYASGYTDDAIGSHGVLDEGVSFIGKPFAPADLANKVRSVLDRLA